MPIDIVGQVEGAEDLLNFLQLAPQTMRVKIWALIRAVALAVMRRIKTEMPVLTGRARASWGVWTPGDIETFSFGEIGGKQTKKRADIFTGNRANKDDAVWEEEKEALTVTQGTNVDYVAQLNEGWSTQAPAGFIDKAANAGMRALADGIWDILSGL